MTRPICVFVLFGFFVQIIPPRGMSICHLYKYTNRICRGFFLWREGHLHPRGSTSPETTQLFRLPCFLRRPPAIPFGQFFYRQRSCFPALSPMTPPLPSDFLAIHDFSSEFMNIDFSFNFGADFSRFDESGYDSSTTGSYEYDSISVDFSVEASSSAEFSICFDIMLVCQLLEARADAR